MSDYIPGRIDRFFNNHPKAWDVFMTLAVYLVGLPFAALAALVMFVTGKGRADA